MAVTFMPCMKHEALMILQQLVRLGIIEFDNEGFVLRNVNIKMEKKND